ncbi:MULTISPECIES: helix-turn-helix domain-containing protein [Roseomonas]|uniref:helix-turn-helix domain-containing protein n=1 Tax=Roseomonas TaxID=125216 RepID=UPI00096A4DB4|nr:MULTISPECIES: helix-turn-helix domain-containing protein [Roseomonas]MCG7351422.1 helix-turn-helix domain-containing protein [Roseomonas mucosa]MCG7358081.1 helix-turn-helix domain-containing protein [Roseomonas mucosa]
MTRKPRGTSALTGSTTATASPATVKAPAEPIRRKSTPKKDELLITVGQRLVEVRKKRGWSQTQLAKLADCPTSSVFAAETGVHNISLLTLKRLADALDVDMRSLLPGPELLLSPHDTSVASLKIIESALESITTDMGRSAVMLQQLRQLLAEVMKPSHLKDRGQ